MCENVHLCSSINLNSYQYLCPCVSGALGSAAVGSMVPADEASRRGSGTDFFQQPGRLSGQDPVLSYDHHYYHHHPHTSELQPPPEPHLPAGQPGSAQPPPVTFTAPPAQLSSCYAP